MNNEQIIRKLIQDSMYRAVQESVAAVLVLVSFTAILVNSPGGSARWYGSLVILVATSFVAGVVWSYALSTKLLRSHSPDDVTFWREAFCSQAKLLRLVPFWYVAPLGAGGLLFVWPASTADLVPFLLVASTFALVFVGVTVLNRAAADRLEESSRQLSAE